MVQSKVLLVAAEAERAVVNQGSQTQMPLGTTLASLTFPSGKAIREPAPSVGSHIQYKNHMLVAGQTSLKITLGQGHEFATSVDICKEFLREERFGSGR